MPHPRPTRRRAGDAAARASGRVGPRGSHVVFTGARRREPIRLQRVPTRADSGRLGLVSAGIGQNGRNSRFRPKFKKKKKKKKTQNAPFYLTLTLLQPSFTQNAKTPSSHFVSLTLSLCSLPLCLSASVSSPLLHQYILSSALSHAFLIYENHVFSYYLLLLLNLVYVCIM